MGYSIRLQRFCCCFTLRTGSLVIGIVKSIYTFSIIIFLGIYMMIGSEKNTDYDNHSSIIHFSIVLVFIGFVLLLICMLLVFGVYKRKKRSLFLWLFIEGIRFNILLLSCLVFLIVLFKLGSEHFTWTIPVFLILCLVIVLKYYCWLCVWSYYMELKGNEEIVAPNVLYDLANFEQALLTGLKL